LNNGLLSRSLEGVAEEDVWKRPAGASNPIGWIAGHVIESRAALLGALAMPFDTGWGAKFARGAMVDAAAGYPTRAELDAAWHGTHSAMRDAFATLTEAKLLEPWTGSPKPGVKNVSDLIAFFAFHESYHVGQLAYVRKLLGYPALAG
jgi:hypothetical protein